MVSCNDLLNLNIFRDIKLVAGESGIYKSISWTYICQTLDFSQWVNGGELMFLTGMGMDLNDDKIINLIHDCIRKDISGLVILTNSEYIKEISDNVIEVANNVGLPIFNMPWNIKLIDVNKEIANYIMELNSNKNKEKELLRELLFSQNLNEEKIKNLINQSKLKSSKYLFVANFMLIEDNITNQSLEYISNIIKSFLYKIDLSFILDIQDNYIICIVGLKSMEDFTEQKNMLISVQKELSKYGQLSLSIGDIYENIYDIKESYNESMKAFKLYKANNWNLEVIDYQSIGFYKILFEVKDYSKLKKYCDEVLGSIIENEKNYSLLETLRCYLKNNCNLINTSQEMFIHRNTLIYRLNKIKKILNSNLENQTLKNELMNAIMIHDYLKCIDYNQEK